MKIIEKDVEMESKLTNNTNKLIKSKSVHNILSKEEAISSIQETINEIEELTDISADDDYSIIYREKEGYSYFLSIETEKRNYIKHEVSFGDIEDLLNRDQIKELEIKINEANKDIKAVKGYIYRFFSEKTKKNELNFSVNYECFSFPSLTKSQLSQHIKASRALMDSYLTLTLDAVYLE